MLFARVRPDLEGLAVPAENGAYIPYSSYKYPCWQPEQIEDDEFNTVILTDCGKAVKVIGFDFEFTERMLRNE